MNWTPLVGPPGLDLRLMAPAFVLSKKRLGPLLCCFCLRCGYVGNAFALSKRSGISTAFRRRLDLSKRARHTAIGIWLFIAWCGRRKL